jgi:hypothetical protein
VRASGAALAERLRARLPEIERTIFVRIEALASSQREDLEYLLGLRSTIHAALEYALDALRLGELTAPPPAALLEQARKAARNQVSLDTVLRRYLAGNALLLDLVIEEASAAGTPRDDLQRIFSTQAVLLDRLLAAVADEHSAEAEALRTASSVQVRRLRTIERLLAGEAAQAPELRYELGAFHTALIASGAEAPRDLREIAASLDRSLLTACPEETTVWAWLGGRRPLRSDELLAALRPHSDKGLTVAIGETSEGIAGWRQSHQQARAAWPIARRGSDSMVRYADVAILASVLQDGLLLDSLRRLYLEPLEGERDHGETLRETLSAYFAAERSAASAAAALGVSRQTVNTRLRAVEERIGRPLGSCGAELEAVLRAEDFRFCGLPGPLAGTTNSGRLSSDKQPINSFVA